MYFNQEIQELLEQLGSSVQEGLSSEEAGKRLEKYGRNQLKEGKKKTLSKKIIEQFSDFLVLILLGAALVSYFAGSGDDALVIIAIVVINAALGIYQEGKAEKSVEALQKMSAPSAKLLRDGKAITLPSSEVVPGDIVFLDAGDILPADLRLIESSNFKVEEASLTGESLPVEKDAQILLPEDTALGDRVNMGYMSTISTYGRGVGLVVETGERTEIGKIAEKIKTIDDEQTPLQKKLNQLGKTLGIATIVICAFVFIIGMLQGRDLLEMAMTSISLAVAGIPEGLPAIVTIVLALGMNNMARRNAIVKKLLAVETLGATSVICSDKTGTLTQNEMTVVSLYADGERYKIGSIGYEPVGEVIRESDAKPADIRKGKALSYLVHAALLANDAKLQCIEGKYSVIGDPTEGSLVTLAGKFGLEREALQGRFERVAELPFDSERKMMTTFHRGFLEEEIISFTKGAPDVIMSRCSKILIGEEELDFTRERREAIEAENLALSRQALRVLAFAYVRHKALPRTILSEETEKEMVLIGLCGMIDPARPEAKIAIEETKRAGITTIMITGDYKETAFAIAKDLGIAESPDQAIMGAELEKISDEELRSLVKKIRVYARVSPEHKVRIVDALKYNGNIVSMTGDGVNDAMALKRADIGVAMGITGTDVVKNAADLILTDDNFATIVHAVEEGRIIYSNIKKFVTFLLSCNIGEILLVFSSILMGLPVPLLPIQLLWLNLVTDSFPAMALGVEKGHEDIMRKKPRDPKEAILNKESWGIIALQAFSVAVATLLSYRFALSLYGSDAEGMLRVRTVVFATLILSELLRAFSARSNRYTLMRIGILSNMKMIWAVGFSFLMMLVVLYVPALNGIFKTSPLLLQDWKIVLSFAGIPLILGELFKLYKSGRERGKKE
ncbi:MAG: cation-translocating P-type ATPase [Johnsonella sp.]|nr:cation-translocating P-type ATPase [Johnsonella sp.]